MHGQSVHLLAPRALHMFVEPAACSGSGALLLLQVFCHFSMPCAEAVSLRNIPLVSIMQASCVKWQNQNMRCAASLCSCTIFTPQEIFQAVMLAWAFSTHCPFLGASLTHVHILRKNAASKLSCTLLPPPPPPLSPPESDETLGLMQHCFIL